SLSNNPTTITTTTTTTTTTPGPRERQVAVGVRVRANTGRNRLPLRVGGRTRQARIFLLEPAASPHPYHAASAPLQPCRDAGQTHGPYTLQDPRRPPWLRRCRRATWDQPGPWRRPCC
ncbi:hypothetical protein, partial [uncultured Thiodictyon sp.]|uniref:hypothetical protein n=1 Tax=uncultured Thiodictyon sp. TaxID=1846217 RepID=UPI0025F055D4